MAPRRKKSPVRAIALILVFLAAVPYLRTAWHPFINYDDQVYVTENAMVTGGMTLGSVRWAFGTGYAANWHPLTWISHMLDCQLFGLNPGAMHLVSAGLQALNVALLFLFLVRATGAPACSTVAAALFALHPLRVESVAWIAERKDVLSGLFWLLTLLAYLEYTRRPTVWRYLLVAGVFTCGLLSKPTVVTLPCVLLLLDFWPLGRLDSLVRLRSLVVEKLPLFALSAAACVVTFLVQRQGGTVVTFQGEPLAERFVRAIFSVYFYLGRIFWPTNLYVPYWDDVETSAWRIAGAVVGLIVITVAVFRMRKSAPFLPVGWFWFLGTLVPVIGLVQVGSQSAADRYTYLPSIGICFAVVWTGAALGRRGWIPQPALMAAAVLSVGGCMWLSVQQVGYWRNSVVLFQHTLEQDPTNLVAIDCLAWTYAADLDPRFRNGAKALELAQMETQVTTQAIGRHDPAVLVTLAAAQAEAGLVPQAVSTAEEALTLPEANAQPLLRDELLKDLSRYRSGKALRDP